MKLSEQTDKRILERELHLRGRVLQAEIERLRERLPDLSDRVSRDPIDTEQLRERLAAESTKRAERIRRSLADTTKQAAYRTEKADLEG